MKNPLLEGRTNVVQPGQIGCTTWPLASATPNAVISAPMVSGVGVGDWGIVGVRVTVTVPLGVRVIVPV